MSTAFPTRTRALGGIGRSRYRRFDGDCASEDDPRVSVSRDPRGTKVAWLESLIVTFCTPFLVGTPPALTTISLPCGVRAVRTATSRDQPPLAAIVALTVGEP